MRIMVTMPSEAARDFGLVRDLVINGMARRRQLLSPQECKPTWADHLAIAFRNAQFFRLAWLASHIAFA